MITKLNERTLRQWRRDSLNSPEFDVKESKEDLYFQMLAMINILNTRILRMTQELLDNHLMKKG